MGLLLAALRALAPMQLPAAAARISQLRTFWAAAPVLHELPMSADVLSACDSVLTPLAPQTRSMPDGGPPR